MHLLLTDPDSTPFLAGELSAAWPSGRVDLLAPGWLLSDLPLIPDDPPTLVFARQLLPNPVQHQADTVRAWADRLWAEALPRLPDARPWRLHVVPHYGVAPAGRNRCRLIRDALIERLRRKHRRLFRTLQCEPVPFDPSVSLVQLALASPDLGWSSTAIAPMPFAFRRVVSPFPIGHVPIAIDKSAPSRAFTKLVEAEQRLGVRIGAGETCVDLGAAPGSWSYVALARGARVTAVDRAPLRDDLMGHPRLEFRRGDAFSFVPDGPVDWLLCDVIAAPQRSIDLLLDWVRQRRARRFVVTIKFRGHAEYALLDPLKHTLPTLCAEFWLTRLCANKNEACAFGEVAPRAPGGSAVLPAKAGK